MNKFTQITNSYINESVIDIPRNSLDPTVFQFRDDSYPIMHPMIKTQIQYDIEDIDDVVHVNRYYVIGSILTNKYSPTSDIDINVEVNARNKMEMEDAIKVIKDINGRLAPGTTHPINYYIMENKYDLMKTDAAYDVDREQWIKEPKVDDDFIDGYMNKFETTVNGIDLDTAELRRDIIDLEELTQLDDKDINGLEDRIHAKLDEIEDTIDSLISNYSNVTNLRKTAYDTDMTPAQIKKYASKNKLPENVTYKLMERYFYIDFLRKIKKKFAEKEIDASDIKDIKKMGKDLWK